VRVKWGDREGSVKGAVLNKEELSSTKIFLKTVYDSRVSYAQRKGGEGTSMGAENFCKRQLLSPLGRDIGSKQNVSFCTRGEKGPFGCKIKGLREGLSLGTDLL